jgi:hypothetical protein
LFINTSGSLPLALELQDTFMKPLTKKYVSWQLFKKIKDELYVISYNENIYLIDRRAEIYKIFKITDIPYHEFTFSKRCSLANDLNT